MSASYPSEPRLSAAIFASSLARLQQLEMLVRECGCLLRQFGEQSDFLLVAKSSESEADDRDWSEIADYLSNNDSEALVWSDLGSIDAAYAALPTERCHFLVETGDWQAVAVLTGTGRRMRKYRLNEGESGDQMLALHRISNELADFARTLARIAEQDDRAERVVRDKPVGFTPAPAGLTDIFGRKPQISATKQANIRTIIKLRRMRDRFFDPALFADPGWDILLDLYAAQQEEKPVSVSSLCIAAAVPPTTALRWITNMTEAGLLVRVQDRDDARRVFIELSAETRKQMEAYFEAASIHPATVI